MEDLFLCGWRVHSEISLPELLPWRHEDCPVDITIRFGDVPVVAEACSWSNCLAQDATGGLRLDIPGVAAYQVSGGNSVTIEPRTAPDSPDIRCFLYGSVLGILCHQRGVFPLHGSCLQMGDGAIVISGPSGTGKSTLAAALARRGHPLLCDDVCVITKGADGFDVRPAFPRAKLKQDAVEALDVRGLPSFVAPNGTEKAHFTFAPFMRNPPRKAPLRAIYFLKAIGDSDTEGIVELDKADRLARIHRQVYRRSIGHRLLRGHLLFRTAAEISAAVSIRQLSRCLSLDRLGETVVRLEHLHGRVSSGTISPIDLASSSRSHCAS